MARRTRAKRKIRSPSPQLPVVNNTGFAALPYELYLEIMSYWPPLPVPTEDPTNYDSLDLRERRFTMLALSQSCRSLRRGFLALLWERIEVYDGMATHGGTLPFHVYNSKFGHKQPKVHKKYAEEIVRQLATVTIHDPSLAQYIKILNLVVTDFNVKSVLAQVARCIKVLPNLHTVQLDFGFHARSQGVENAFASDTYPQIRTVCLSSEASIFMLSCPNLRRVTAYQGHFWRTFRPFESFIPHFANVETLGIVYADCDTRLERIVQAMPRLRDITLDIILLRKPDFTPSVYGLNPKMFTPTYPKLLTQLRYLRTIRIKLNLPSSIRYHTVYYSRKVPSISEEIAAWVEQALKILSKIPDNSDLVERRVILTRPNGEIQVFNVPLPLSVSINTK